jgi:hypothetical protein
MNTERVYPQKPQNHRSGLDLGQQLGALNAGSPKSNEMLATIQNNVCGSVVSVAKTVCGFCGSAQRR